MKELRLEDLPLIRLYNAKNYGKFVNCIEQTDFSAVLLENNVNDAYGIFHKQMCEVHDKYFPKVRVSRSKHKSKPWVTAGLKNQ